MHKKSNPSTLQVFNLVLNYDIPRRRHPTVMQQAASEVGTAASVLEMARQTFAIRVRWEFICFA
jgi:hypothetical protein